MGGEMGGGMSGGMSGGMGGGRFSTPQHSYQRQVDVKPGDMQEKRRLHLCLDLPGKIVRFPDRPIIKPNFEGQSATKCEAIGREYAQSMPGTWQLFLDAGDFCLYRNMLWHLSNYVPYTKG